MKPDKFSVEFASHSMKHSLQRILVLVLLLFMLVSFGSFSSPITRGAQLSTKTSTHSIATPTHTVTWDRYSLKLDGKRLMVWSGEFHYWRLPSPALWSDVLEKIKAAGFNTISIYFDWAYHSPKAGVYDFTGIRDVNKLLTIAQQIGLYVIARPGPYINAETDAGGFPGWLITQAGRARSSASDYTAAYMDWLSHIDPILAQHQITNGGNIILYQVENEYTSGSLDATYMQQIENKVRADGITVPLDHNDSSLRGTWAPGKAGGVDLYAFDSYPQGFNCSNPTHWSGVPQFETKARQVSPNTPIFIAEFQGGSFDPWGGPGYAKCQQLTGPDFVNVFYKTLLSEGVTMLNSYMTYGGTSWGWLPEPTVYSSYDYGAAIDEARQLTPKYYAMKRIGYMLQAVDPISATNLTTGATVSNSVINVQQRVNPTTQAHFLFLRHNDATATTNDTFQVTFTSPDGTYTVPQQSGTTLRLNGRDSKILVADYNFGAQHLVYSTSEILTQTTIDNRDIAMLYGRNGENGETVLHYATQPQVTVLSGSVTSTYANGNLRLNYVHSSGLTQVLIHGGTRDLLLLLGNDDVASHIWLDQTSAGPVLSYGPYLVRSAASSNGVLNLTGDTDSKTNLVVFAPSTIGQIDWNGRLITSTGNPAQSTLPGPQAVTLPTLTNWKFQAKSPESQPSFNDTSWTQTNASHLPMDYYGFHYGLVWYRGHFTATGSETGITIDGETGAHGVYSVWLNGAFLGSFSTGSHTISIPAGTLKAHTAAEVSVLIGNMGHNEDFSSSDTHKSPRGLTTAALQGSTAAISWKIQGDKGGENIADPVRGPFNTGGLYGERNGWYLPGFNTANWKSVTLPNCWSTSGVPAGVGWYRTSFNLNLPANMDVPIGLHITDATFNYQALIYVNGWLVGRYWNTVGPQTTFSLPAGILNTNGSNTVAIAVWGLGAQSGGLGQVSLTSYGAYAQ